MLVPPPLFLIKYSHVHGSSCMANSSVLGGRLLPIDTLPVHRFTPTASHILKTILYTEKDYMARERIRVYTAATTEDIFSTQCAVQSVGFPTEDLQGLAPLPSPPNAEKSVKYEACVSRPASARGARGRRKDWPSPCPCCRARCSSSIRPRSRVGSPQRRR